MKGKWNGLVQRARFFSRPVFCGWPVAAMVGVVLLTGALPAPVHAQTTPLQRQEQRQRAQQQAQQRERRQQQPEVRLQKSLSTDYRQHALPKESPCFTLTAIHLVGSHRDDFSWLPDYLQHYVGRCVGQRGLSLIVRRATDLILARGYVTTRLLIPQQDLSTGKLRLLLVPGVIGAIRYAPGSVHAYWRNALPLRPGDLLNLRDIEQGLEQMKRVPSQDVHISIAPGSKPGVSDLVLDVQRTCCYRVNLSYNDAGSEFTGRQQGGISVAVDQPLDINDLLSIDITGYVGHVSGKGTQGNSLRYSVPWDNWTFAFSSSGYAYHQQVHGTRRNFETGGRSRTTALSIKRMLHRGASSVTSLQLTLSGREAHSDIEDVEIQVQRRHTSAVELAVLQRRYIGRAQLDVSVAQRRGVSWFGGQTDAPEHPHDAPTFQYVIDTFDAQLSLPFHWGTQNLLWSSTLHAQGTGDHLYAEDFITIGGRYTVRGFAGEHTLGAEHGWFWRNSLGLPLGGGVRVYGGFDVGRIDGPGARAGYGKSLSGAFIGLRGAEHGLSWNLFAGWALHAPDNFSTRRPAGGMQVIYQF